MALEAGVRVGGYEIVAPLGTGGMSEVYRARDLTLGREVALKLLPTHWEDDPDRVARFEREAQLLAALNHPNIAIIHGWERVDSRTFLVLELVPGQTLSEKLARGPIRLDEALRIFLQIALALEAAHGKGIIHRDLKPANVKITEAGVVKLLDFGLGKDLGPGPVPGLDPKTATYVGRGESGEWIVGTPPYMSPEQARGRALGRATDIWSFGVTFFEALSGRSPFLRETVSDTIAAVLHEEPPWNVLPPIPRAIAALLRRSMRKDERQRIHDVADIRIELEDAIQNPAELRAPDGSAREASRWTRLGVVLGALALSVTALVLASLWLASLWFSGGADTGSVRRFTIELPATAPLSLENGNALAVSPDATRLVYSARLGERRQLFVRPLAELEPAPIPGTEGAESPFFSPAGDWIGFVAGGKLEKMSTVSLGGGSPTLLADAPAPRGIAWLESEAHGGSSRIVFSSSSARFLQSVPDSGGTVSPASALDDPAVRDHRWPAALPGGNEALVTLWSESGFDIGIVQLASGKTTRVLADAFYPRYLSSGHVLFARGDGLYAAAFDGRSGSVVSEPVRLVERLATDPRTGAAFYEIAADGTLFYVSSEGLDDGAAGQRAVALLVDRRGEGRPIVEPRASLQVPRFSPDGRRLLLTVGQDDTTDLWIFDRARGTGSRLTLQGNNGSGVFSPDGRRIAFASDRDGVFSIYSTLSDGSAPAERLTRAENPQFPTSFSPDGRFLAYTELAPETRFDIFVLALDGSGNARPFLRTRYEEAGAVFSPDGRFLAYTSDESGTKEVYVRRFPGPEGKWQISTDSGAEPVWSRDGSSIFFRSGDRLMVSTFPLGAEPAPGRPAEVFEAPFDTAGSLYADYDVGPEPDTFVMIRSEKERTATRIRVIEHFSERVRERVPSRN